MYTKRKETYFVIWKSSIQDSSVEWNATHRRNCFEIDTGRYQNDMIQKSYPKSWCQNHLDKYGSLLAWLKQEYSQWKRVSSTGGDNKE